MAKKRSLKDELDELVDSEYVSPSMKAKLKRLAVKHAKKTVKKARSKVAKGKESIRKAKGSLKKAKKKKAKKKARIRSTPVKGKEGVDFKTFHIDPNKPSTCRPRIEREEKRRKCKRTCKKGYLPMKVGKPKCKTSIVRFIEL